MSNDLLKQALKDIAEDETMTAAQKLKKQAEVVKHHRSITGVSEKTLSFSRKDKTSVVGTFFRSIARTAGRNFVKNLFK